MQPILVTAASPYPYNSEPALSPDETKAVFNCGNQPYGGTGTALCEVGIDGQGFHVVIGPTGVQPEFAGAQAVDHASYAPDGSLVFRADRSSTQVWRLPPGDKTPVVVGNVFDNDNAPCVLPNGGIASLWLGDTGSPNTYQIKFMLPSDRTFVVLPAGDIAPDEIGCSD
jgi:hypothetical protein